MAMLKRLLMVLVAVLLIAVPATVAQGAPGGGPGKPPDAGNGGGGNGGGGQGNKGNKLGDLYADLWVVARDASGKPVLDGNNCLQPITDVKFDQEAELVATGYPYDGDRYFIPLVGVPTVTTMDEAEDEDELEPCDVVADKAYLVEEVDLGRLNLGRAPERVLSRQLGEVELFLSQGDLGLDASGRFTSGDLTLDAPLANIAAYQAILETGSIGDTAVPSLGLSAWELTAAELAAGSPKEGFAITVDTVQYLNRILGVPIGAVNPPLGMPVLTEAVLGETFLDFATVPGYTRSTMFPGQIYFFPPGEDETCVPILNKVFPDPDVEGAYVDASETGGLAAYVQFAEDARKVLVAVHAIGEDYLIDVDSIKSDDIKGDYADCVRD